MALKFMQTVKDQKVSKGRTLQILPSQTKYQAFATP